MKFERFDGTADAGKRADHADGVKEVRVSQATQRDAAGLKDRDSIVAALQKGQGELTGLNVRIAQIDTELARLNRKVRGRSVPRNEYESICDEQGALVAEKQALQTSQADLKVRLARLRKDLAAVDDSRPVKPDRLDITNEILRSVLTELRKISALLADRQESRVTDNPLSPTERSA